MKTYKKPATSKLVARYDNELKKLLLEDIRNYREHSRFALSHTQNAAQQRLSVA